MLVLSVRAGSLVSIILAVMMNIKTKLESVLNIRKKKKQHILKDETKREQVYCMSVLCGSMCGGTKLKDHKDKFCQDDVSGSGGVSLYFIVLNLYTYVFNDVSFVCLSLIFWMMSPLSYSFPYL